MILPPELQKYIYVLDDAPGAVEAIVRYCADLVAGDGSSREHILAQFDLDVPAGKLEKVG